MHSGAIIKILAVLISGIFCSSLCSMSAELDPCRNVENILNSLSGQIYSDRVEAVIKHALPGYSIVLRDSNRSYNSGYSSRRVVVEVNTGGVVKFASCT